MTNQLKRRPFLVGLALTLFSPLYIGQKVNAEEEHDHTLIERIRNYEELSKRYDSVPDESIALMAVSPQDLQTTIYNHDTLDTSKDPLLKKIPSSARAYMAASTQGLSQFTIPAYHQTLHQFPSIDYTAASLLAASEEGFSQFTLPDYGQIKKELKPDEKGKEFNDIAAAIMAASTKEVHRVISDYQKVKEKLKRAENGAVVEFDDRVAAIMASSHKNIDVVIADYKIVKKRFKKTDKDGKPIEYDDKAAAILASKGNIQDVLNDYDRVKDNLTKISDVSAAILANAFGYGRKAA